MKAELLREDPDNSTDTLNRFVLDLIFDLEAAEAREAELLACVQEYADESKWAQPNSVAGIAHFQKRIFCGRGDTGGFDLAQAALRVVVGHQLQRRK